MKKIISIIALLAVTQLQATYFMLIMSKDDKVCQHMGVLYQQDISKKGKIVLEDHKEYNWLTWDEEVSIKIGINFNAKKSKIFKKKVFDINNDKKDEEIFFRRTDPTSKRDYRTDNLYYTNNGYKIKYNEDTIYKLNIEKKWINLDGDNPFELNELPIKYISSYGTSHYTSMGGGGPFLIHPFIFQDKTYLSLFGNIGLQAHEDVTWQENIKNDITIKNGIVIKQYDKNNTLNDICYFIRPQPMIIKTGEK